jgi:hypothetical protein
MTIYGPRRKPDESLDGSPQPSATEIAAMRRLEAVWRDFGGPSASDIFIEFGISVEEFYRRLNRARSQLRPGTAVGHTSERLDGSTSDGRADRPPGPRPGRGRGHAR